MRFSFAFVFLFGLVALAQSKPSIFQDFTGAAQKGVKDVADTFNKFKPSFIPKFPLLPFPPKPASKPAPAPSSAPATEASPAAEAAPEPAAEAAPEPAPEA